MMPSPEGLRVFDTKMLAIAILVITWVAGILSARMTESTQPEEPHAETTESKYLKLDALKAIRESAYQRWDKRRSYEWQLSISIWTAVAAFSGIVISKDFVIENVRLVALVVGGVGICIVALHTYYFWNMVCHTLGDAEIQRWAESRIYRLAFGGCLDEDAKNCADYKRKFEFYPRLSRHGYAQIIITAVLVLAAFLAVLAPHRQAKSDPAPCVMQCPSSQQK
jgi:hypothetical protein